MKSILATEAAIGIYIYDFIGTNKMAYYSKVDGILSILIKNGHVISYTKIPYEMDFDKFIIQCREIFITIIDESISPITHFKKIY